MILFLKMKIDKELFYREKATSGLTLITLG